MGRRRNCVGSLRNHAGPGYIPYDFSPGQVASDARLRALSHLDFNRRASLQIVLVNAKPAGGHLHDGIGTIGIEILVQSAFAGIVKDAQLPGRSCQGGMGLSLIHI